MKKEVDENSLDFDSPDTNILTVAKELLKVIGGAGKTPGTTTGEVTIVCEMAVATATVSIAHSLERIAKRGLLIWDQGEG